MGSTSFNREVTFEAFARAREGDRQAMSTLIDCLRPLIVRTAHQYGPQRCDVDDIVQEVNLAILRKVADVRSEDGLLAWVRRVTINASFSAGRNRHRIVLVDDLGERSEPADAIGECDTRLPADAADVVGRAISRLCPSDQQLVQLLMASARPNYETISRTVGRPIGSIGPTRGRILTKLRKDPALRELAIAVL